MPNNVCIISACVRVFFKTHSLVYYHFFFPLKWAHSRECICLRDFSFFCYRVCVWAVLFLTVVLRVSYPATHVRIFFGTYEKLACCLYRCTTHLKSYFYEHSGHIEYFVFFSRSLFFCWHLRTRIIRPHVSFLQFFVCQMMVVGGWLNDIVLNIVTF